MNRRGWLKAAPITLGAATGVIVPESHAAAGSSERTTARPFRISFNTSTIMGQKVPIVDEVDMVAEAGYDAIEPWIRELDEYEKQGGSLADLKKRISDKGLAVESSIGFFDWAVDDEEKRKRGLEEGKRSMELVRQIGGKRLAAPPTGITDQAPLPREVLVERFRAVQAIGDEMGVVPQLEVWGFSKNVTTLADAAAIALATGHPKACVLADVYHLYKGGSPFETLPLLSGLAMQVFHVNDYPSIPPAEIKDEHRVYPGDGIAPLAEVFRALDACGFSGIVSLELFNRQYWAQDPKKVVREGFEKMKAALGR